MVVESWSEFMPTRASSATITRPDGGSRNSPCIQNNMRHDDPMETENTLFTVAEWTILVFAFIGFVFVGVTLVQWVVTHVRVV